MTDDTSTPATSVGGRSPVELSDPRARFELTRAIIWISVILAVVLTYVLSQPLLLIVGGLVFASMLDGGARLLGRVLPIGRGWRITLVALLVFVFILGVISYAGLTLVGQFQALKSLVFDQVTRLQDWVNSTGLLPPSGIKLDAIGQQVMGSLGTLTSAVGTALGAVSSAAMIIVLGLFFAAEPRIYERGLVWLVPQDKRDDFFHTLAMMAKTLRLLMAGRLLGMAAEGAFIWVALSLVGVPFALLLGIITGILAFLPNIGAIISGALVILVGFSQGSHTGLMAVAVYIAVQIFDGYLVVPMVARRSVDLPQALVLGMQLLLGALFGLLGLMFADPIVAMAKVALERQSGLDADPETDGDAKKPADG